MSASLDPRFTFEAFVVGPANRLAAAAARKAAELPGQVYNPLFIYGASGLGKTHLLSAIGLDALRRHAKPVTFETTPQLLESMAGPATGGAPGLPPPDAIIEASHRRLREQLGIDPVESAPPPTMGGGRPQNPGSGLRARLENVAILLLDDVQFMAGEREAQEELLRILDTLTDRRAQVVLASDRPPQEIDGLDDRLLTRLSGGLIVDIGSPDFETRLEITQRRAQEQGIDLLPETIHSVATLAFSNVREIQGALNRLAAFQELEKRHIQPHEVPHLLGRPVDREVEPSQPGVHEVEPSQPGVHEAEPSRVGEAAHGPTPDARGAISPLAMRAARAVAMAPGRAHNPLYFLGPDQASLPLLTALTRKLEGMGLTVAFTDSARFSEELIQALEDQRLDAWRDRYRQAQALVLTRLHQLAGLEQGHEELFHLFEYFQDQSRQLVFSGRLPPQRLPLPPRLRSRLEAGLVVELDGAAAPPPPARAAAPVPDAGRGAGAAPAPPAAELIPAPSAANGPGAPGGAILPSREQARPDQVEPTGALRSASQWILSPEKVLLEWPYEMDWIERAPD